MAQHVSRRAFLAGTGAAAVGVAASPFLGGVTAEAAMNVAAPNTPLQPLGIQLFTVRAVLTSLGFRRVLEELARRGYRAVEFTCFAWSTAILGRKITPAEIRQALDDN